MPDVGAEIADLEKQNLSPQEKAAKKEEIYTNFAAASDRIHTVHQLLKAYDIIRAILLGDDDTMESDLKASYAAAGVSHILCVSGMHVGIIFMIIDFILKPLDLFRSTRIVKTLLIVTVIWLYAGITGLSPSVTRSATMFTFVSAGTLIPAPTPFR